MGRVVSGNKYRHYWFIYIIVHINIFLLRISRISQKRIQEFAGVLFFCIVFTALGAFYQRLPHAAGLASLEFHASADSLRCSICNSSNLTPPSLPSNPPPSDSQPCLDPMQCRCTPGNLIPPLLCYQSTFSLIFFGQLRYISLCRSNKNRRNFQNNLEKKTCMLTGLFQQQDFPN